MEACGLRLRPSRDSKLLSRAPDGVRRRDGPPAIQARAPRADKQEKVGPGEMLVAAQQMEGARPLGQAHSQTPGRGGLWGPRPRPDPRARPAGPSAPLLAGAVSPAHEVCGCRARGVGSPDSRVFLQDYVLAVDAYRAVVQFHPEQEPQVLSCIGSRRYGTLPWASREGRTGTRPYQKSDQTRTRIRILCHEEVISLQSSAHAEDPSTRFLCPGPGD